MARKVGVRRTARPGSFESLAGIALQVARIRAGLRLQDLAKRTGMSPTRLSEKERGLGVPNLRQLVLVSKILDVPIDDLIPKNADPSSEGRGRRPAPASPDPLQ